MNDRQKQARAWQESFVRNSPTARAVGERSSLSVVCSALRTYSDARLEAPVCIADHECGDLIDQTMKRQRKAILARHGWTAEELEAELAKRLSDRSAHDWSAYLLEAC
jgi:hypothetical protein